MSIDLKGIGKSVLSQFVDIDEDKPPIQEQAPKKQAYQPPIPAPPQDAAPSAADSSDAYARLYEITDLTKQPPIQTVEKYLAPLAPLALDDKTKFNIAVRQARAQDNLEPLDILKVFDALKDRLERERAEVAERIARATTDQVESKRKQAADLSAQIENLRQQVAQLTEDGFAAQQKIQAAQHKFDGAMQRRQTELAQEQAKYASLLA